MLQFCSSSLTTTRFWLAFNVFTVYQLKKSFWKCYLRSFYWDKYSTWHAIEEQDGIKVIQFVFVYTQCLHFHFLIFLILDWHAEEDASHWNHHPRSQPHGDSWVCQGFQGGVQLWWQNIHSVQSGWSEKRQSKKCKCYQYNTSLPYVLKAIIISLTLYFLRCLWEIQIMMEQRQTCLTHPLWPSIFASFLWCAVKLVLSGWNLWAVS